MGDADDASYGFGAEGARRDQVGVRVRVCVCVVCASASGVREVGEGRLITFIIIAL
jgi:hypothetical protein